MSNTKETEAEILRRFPAPPVVMKKPPKAKPSPQQLVDDFIAKAKSARDKAVAAEIQRLREPQGRMAQEDVALDAIMALLESGRFDAEPDGALCGLIVFDDDEIAIRDSDTYVARIRALSDDELADWLAEVAASGLDVAPNECPWCGDAEPGDEPDWDEEHTSACEAVRAHNALPDASWDNDDDGHDLVDAAGKLAHAFRAEIARLRAEAGAINDALGVTDASVAPAVIRELHGRVDELLAANNRYQQEARDERTLRKAREIALECVALNYSALREQAQQAAVALTRLLPGGLQADPAVDKLVKLAFKEAVFSPDFPKGEPTPTTATDPYQHNPGARPMPHPGAK